MSYIHFHKVKLFFNFGNYAWDSYFDYGDPWFKHDNTWVAFEAPYILIFFAHVPFKNQNIYTKFVLLFLPKGRNMFWQSCTILDIQYKIYTIWVGNYTLSGGCMVSLLLFFITHMQIYPSHLWGEGNIKLLSSSFLGGYCPMDFLLPSFQGDHWKWLSNIA